MTLPSPFTAKLGAGDTPHSTSKNSFFSPGEGFWNEAILIADGLVAPHDGRSLHQAANTEALKNEYESSNSNNAKKGVCNNLLDKTPCSVSGIACDVESASHAKDLVKVISPLPVKHLHFGFEGKNGEEELSFDAKVSKSSFITSDMSNYRQTFQSMNLLPESHINQNIRISPDAEQKRFESVVSNKNKVCLNLESGNMDRENEISVRDEIKSLCTPSSSSVKGLSGSR